MQEQQRRGEKAAGLSGEVESSGRKRRANHRGKEKPVGTSNESFEHLTGDNAVKTTGTNKGKEQKVSNKQQSRAGHMSARGKERLVGTSADLPSKTRSTGKREGLPVQKNDEVIVNIVGLSHDGEGVGRYEGFTLFVKGTLPGERALVHVLKVKKQYGYAKLLRLIERSPERTEPPCPIFEQCGGCQLQHLNYEAQLHHKRQLVVDSLERIGKLRVNNSRSGEGASGDSRSDSSVVHEGADGTREGGASQVNQNRGGGSDSSEGEWSDGAGASGIIVHPTLGMDEPWRYRNKAQVPFGEEEGGLVAGFYAQGSHRIVDMDSCLIQHESNDEVIAAVKAIARDLGITAYDEATHRGILRHVVVKYGFATKEVMIVLITNGTEIPRKNEWIQRIREAFPSVLSICQNINPKRTNVIFGDETKVLWGQPVIHDTIGDVKFAISPRSFYQVNPQQTEVLYRKALEYAQLSGEETVIDAYCGIGTISLFLAQHANKVYGVEIIPEAIEDARVNAELNGLTNVEFAVGAAEHILPEWKNQGIRPEIIVVDPPRKGCDEALLETILVMKPERVVYVSCNPATLARDLRVLEDGGYQTIEVQPVDMFPHTTHVECTVLLKRG